MPNTHDQVTRDDFKAPEGKYRIMREEMSDGLVTVVSDFNNPPRLALICLRALRAEFTQDMFTLWNDQGVNIESPKEEDHTEVNPADMPGGEIWDQEPPIDTDE